MWGSLPVNVWLGDVTDGFVRDCLREGISYWRDTSGNPLFRECSEQPAVGVRVRLSSHDAQGRRVWGALFSWDEDEGMVSSFVRGTVVVHPHVPPHRLQDFLWHELGHALGLRDASAGMSSLSELMRPRPLVGPSHDARTEYREVLRLGRAVVETDPLQSMELVGRAVLIAGADLEDTEAMAFAYVSLSVSYVNARLFDLAREVLERARLLARSSYVQSRVCCALASCVASSDGFRRALPLFRAARDACVAIRDQGFLVTIYSSVAMGLYRLGRRRSAARFFCHAAGSGDGISGSVADLEVHLNIARSTVLSRLCEGDGEGALGLLSSPVELWADHPWPRAQLCVEVANDLVGHDEFALASRAALLAIEGFAAVGALRAASLAFELGVWSSRACRDWSSAFRCLAYEQAVLSVDGSVLDRVRWYAVYVECCLASGERSRLGGIPQLFLNAAADAASDVQGEVVAYLRRCRERYGIGGSCLGVVPPSTLSSTSLYLMGS